MAGWFPLFAPPAGWIPLTPSGDTNFIYVSNSAGVDASGNGTFANPVKTIAYALTAGHTIGTLGVGFRNGHADWVLFKDTDTWTNEQLTLPGSAMSGRSASEPFVVCPYGAGVTAGSPQGTPAASPLLKFNGGFTSTAMQFEGSGVSNWVFDGLTLYATGRDPNHVDFVGAGGGEGLSWIALSGSTSNIVFQDMVWRYFTSNGFGGGTPVLTAMLYNNIKWRRCQFLDSYSESGHSQGVFMSQNANTEFIENFFDHCGWNENSTLFAAGANAVVFNRNYYQNCFSGPVVFKGNISLNSSAEGAQHRSGGTIYNNLYAYSSDGFDLGHGQDPGDDMCPVLGAETEASFNVILKVGDVHDSPSVDPRGTAINVINCGPGVNIHDNIIAHLGASTAGSSNVNLIQLQSGGTLGTTSGVKFQNNIGFDWAGNSGNTPIVDQGTGDVTTPNAIDMAGANSAGYPSPSRLPADYAGTVGLTATLAGFIAACRANRKYNWNPALTAPYVNNYIRAGFGLAAI